MDRDVLRRFPAGRLLAIAAALLAVLTALALVAPVARADTTATKAAPPVTIGEFSSQAAPPLTGTALAQENQKQATAAQFFTATKAAWTAAAAGRAHPDTCVSAPCSGAAPTSLTLPELYLQQTSEYNCGAATTAMVASYLGVGWSGSSAAQQSSAGSLLGTTTAGTAWEGADHVPSYPGVSANAYDYPVADTLDYRLYQAKKKEWYTAQPLPGSPTSAQQSAFLANLVYDIAHNYPEADNQDSVTNYNIGYQPNQPWQHWWSARGYAGSGSTTYFNDPASWSKSRMSSAPTTGGQHTVVAALGGRGYIW